MAQPKLIKKQPKVTTSPSSDQKAKPKAKVQPESASVQAPELQVEFVSIDKVKRWSNNSWDKTKQLEAAKQLAEIIRLNGLRSPIVVWRKNMTIAKGNTTHMALELLGYKKVPVLFQEFKSQAAFTAYAIGDNKASELNKWDDKVLKNLLSADDMKAFAPDAKTLAAFTGFSEKEIKGLTYHTGDNLPNALPDVDIQGVTPGKADYLILPFDDQEVLKKFKERFGMKAAHARVVQYKVLMNLMVWRKTPKNAEE
jgi:hypothetical protein